jgi:hypothetical protein
MRAYKARILSFKKTYISAKAVEWAFACEGDSTAGFVTRLRVGRILAAAGLPSLNIIASRTSDGR